MTHTEGESVWRMRPARPAEGGTGYITYRAVWREEPDCWMLDCSTQEEHPDYRSALAAVIEKRKAVAA
jgi:hypothetical protein